MRGAPDRGRVACAHPWIIPADAGSTSCRSTPGCPRQDHPRGCGEHALTVSACMRLTGSSPRMRGAPRQYWPCGRKPGIIPADAGSTKWAGRNMLQYSDHPRGCGEHQPASGPTSHVSGSSPRMRGAPCRFCSCSYTTRIIPADAGSTHGGT